MATNGARIDHNWIYNTGPAERVVSGDGIYIGIYYDFDNSQGGGECYADHNVIWNTAIPIQHNQAIRDHFYNNTTYATTNRLSYFDVTHIRDNLVYRNNLDNGNTGDLDSQPSNYNDANALTFRNAAHNPDPADRDFRLAESADYAINAGVKVGAPFDDDDTPSIGAYDPDAPAWMAGRDSKDRLLPQPPVLLTKGQGTVTARGGGGSEGPEKAFDHNIGSKWLDGAARTWLAYEFPGQKGEVVNRYTLTSGNDAPERDVRSWTLQGSADGRNWTDLDKREDQHFPARSFTRGYLLNNSKAYRFYRLNDITNQDGTITQLQEVQWLRGQ